MLEFDFLKVDAYLLKLIEASHLNDVRVNKTDRSKSQKILPTSKPSAETEPDEKNENETEDYSSDPYIIIHQFFLDGTIEDGRDDLHRLFEAAFPEEIVTKSTTLPF